MQKPQETWVGSLGQEDPLEEEVATHSSILAWGIPWTEEPGRLESVGSRRVGRDGSYLAHMHLFLLTGFPGGSVVKKPRASAENVGSVPGLGSSAGEGNGNPLQYSCLGNSVARGAWWATVHGVAKNQT